MHAGHVLHANCLLPHVYTKVATAAAFAQPRAPDKDSVYVFWYKWLCPLANVPMKPPIAASQLAAAAAAAA